MRIDDHIIVKIAKYTSYVGETNSQSFTVLAGPIVNNIDYLFSQNQSVSDGWGLGAGGVWESGLVFNKNQQNMWSFY